MLKVIKISENEKKEENKHELDMEEIFDKSLEKTGFKTLVKLQPNHPGEEGDKEIDEMLAMLGLKKGKLVAKIDSRDFKVKKDE